MSETICQGILEITENGFGFLRDPKDNFAPRAGAPFVPAPFIQRNGLREGLLVEADTEASKKYPKQRVLKRVISCNGVPFDDYKQAPEITELVSINPEEQFNISRGQKDLTGKLIDALVPVARGQRGMIISPPKAGKTTILKHVALSVLENHPEVRVIILLVDERPEEVTDFRREVPGAEVYFSSSDQDEDSHLRHTRLTMNMATREAELGKDVVVLIDSLTRMGRAFNKSADSGGKTLSGGLAANALELPRRFFGAARNIEDGGSLTILATVLVDTGSRMDEVIFQEFKGTGNMELVLSRECAERRIFPAVNIRESGTRKEDIILSSEAMRENANWRRVTASMKEVEAMEFVLDRIR